MGMFSASKILFTLSLQYLRVRGYVEITFYKLPTHRVIPNKCSRSWQNKINGAFRRSLRQPWPKCRPGQVNQLYNYDRLPLWTGLRRTPVYSIAPLTVALLLRCPKPTVDVSIETRYHSKVAFIKNYCYIGNSGITLNTMTVSCKYGILFGRWEGGGWTR